MENSPKITPTPWTVAHYKTYSEIQAINGNHVCYIKQEKQEDIIPIGSFIVTACNNYQALKAENTLLKEVNEAQIFTIENYQKENEEFKQQIKTLNDIIDKAIEKNL
jgi:aerobic-type carbon monoxide dehydrogenase small subunit (CoxS/CutS family)